MGVGENLNTIKRRRYNLKIVFVITIMIISSIYIVFAESNVRPRIIPNGDNQNLYFELQHNLTNAKYKYYGYGYTVSIYEPGPNGRLIASKYLPNARFNPYMDGSVEKVNIPMERIYEMVDMEDDYYSVKNMKVYLNGRLGIKVNGNLSHLYDSLDGSPDMGLKETGLQTGYATEDGRTVPLNKDGFGIRNGLNHEYGISWSGITYANLSQHFGIPLTVDSVYKFDRYKVEYREVGTDKAVHEAKPYEKNTDYREVTEYPETVNGYEYSGNFKIVKIDCNNNRTDTEPYNGKIQTGDRASVSIKKNADRYIITFYYNKMDPSKIGKPVNVDVEYREKTSDGKILKPKTTVLGGELSPFNLSSPKIEGYECKGHFVMGQATEYFYTNVASFVIGKESYSKPVGGRLKIIFIYKEKEYISIPKCTPILDGDAVTVNIEMKKTDFERATDIRVDNAIFKIDDFGAGKDKDGKAVEGTHEFRYFDFYLKGYESSYDNFGKEIRRSFNVPKTNFVQSTINPNQYSTSIEATFAAFCTCFDGKPDSKGNYGIVADKDTLLINVNLIENKPPDAFFDYYTIKELVDGKTDKLEKIYIGRETIIENLATDPNGIKDIRFIKYNLTDSKGKQYYVKLLMLQDGSYILDSDNVSANNIEFLGAMDNGDIKLKFKTDEMWQVSQYVEDIDGLNDTYSLNLKAEILNLRPIAVIKDDIDYRFPRGYENEFKGKQNRVIELNSNSSYVAEFLKGTGVTINHNRDCWEIVPLDGQSFDSIKFENDYNAQVIDDVMQIKYTALNNVKMMFKEKGRYLFRLQVTDTDGNVSDWKEQILTIQEDLNPIVTATLNDKYYRNAATKKATISFNALSKSTDEDYTEIKDIKYKYDSDNDGSFDDEASQSTNLTSSDVVIDGITYRKITLLTSNIGNYQFEVVIKEDFGQETIDKYINESDYRTGSTYVVTEVDNIAPVGTLGLQKENNIDVKILTCGLSDIQDATVASNVETFKSLVESQYNINCGNVEVLDMANTRNGLTAGNGLKWRRVIMGSNTKYRNGLIDSAPRYIDKYCTKHGGDYDLLFGCCLELLPPGVEATGWNGIELPHMWVQGGLWENAAKANLINHYAIDRDYYIYPQDDIAYVLDKAYSIEYGNNYIKKGYLGSFYGYTGGQHFTAITDEKIKDFDISVDFSTYFYKYHGIDDHCYTNMFIFDVQDANNYYAIYRLNCNSEYCTHKPEYERHSGILWGREGLSYPQGVVQVKNGEITFLKEYTGKTRHHSKHDDDDYIESTPINRVKKSGDTITVYNDNGVQIHQFTVDSAFSGKSGYLGFGTLDNSDLINSTMSIKSLTYMDNSSIYDSLDKLSWGTDTDKYVINIVADNKLDEISNNEALIKTAAKLQDKGITLINVGVSSLNATRLKEIVTRNDNAGTYIELGDIPTNLKTAAAYIRDFYKSKTTAEDYMLVGSKIKYDENYSDAENDDLYSKFFMFSHIPSYFESPLGTIDNNNAWITSPIELFNKTGKYTINYQVRDNPLNNTDKYSSFDEYRRYSTIYSRLLYVHRKPIASFGIDSGFAANVLKYYTTPYGDISAEVKPETTVHNETIKEDSFKIDKDAFDISLTIKTYYSPGYVYVDPDRGNTLKHYFSRNNTYTFDLDDRAEYVSIEYLDVDRADVTLTYSIMERKYTESRYDIAINLPDDAIKAKFTYTGVDYDDAASINFYADGVNIGSAIYNDESHTINVPAGTDVLSVVASDYTDYTKRAYIHGLSVSYYQVNSGVTVPITENSYDIDHRSESNKGIVMWEWKVIKKDGTVMKSPFSDRNTGIAWVQNNLSSLAWKDAIVMLRVKDKEGEWSDWTSTYIDEDKVSDPNSDNTDLTIYPPKADFTLEYDEMIYKTQVQKVYDASSDPQGLQLVYSWKVYKGSTLLFNSSDKDISKSLNEKILANGIGDYSVKLKVTNSKGLSSDEVTKTFRVTIFNNEPTANFELVSNENPAWTFPKTLGLHYLKYRPHNTLFYEEHARFDTYVHDSNADNLGFIYNWKLERFAVKDINAASGTATNTYNYATQFPFVNSFKNQGLPWGAYRITLSVTDKPPIPPYQQTDAKTATVTKNYYIVPEINVNGSYESAKSEIMVGDTIKLKAKTSKLVDWTDCLFDGVTYGLDKVSEDGSFAYWEKNIVVPDTITESGTYNLKYVAKTTYGGNGNITREVQDNVPIDIVALKLINFRITNIVNHPHITFPYTKDMLISKLIPYKTGYYVTFRIDSKGKPDDVWGRVDVGNNGSIDQIISMSKVESGDTETWQGRFYVGTRLPINTVISIKLDCKKGTTVYDYNQKENWDGRSLITNGSALQDGRINLTN